MFSMFLELCLLTRNEYLIKTGKQCQMNTFVIEMLYFTVTNKQCIKTDLRKMMLKCEADPLGPGYVP
jgi:hypothetical protein